MIFLNTFIDVVCIKEGNKVSKHMSCEEKLHQRIDPQFVKVYNAQNLSKLPQKNSTTQQRTEHTRSDTY